MGQQSWMGHCLKQLNKVECRLALVKGANFLCRLLSKYPMGQALGTPASEGLCLPTDGWAALGCLEYVWGYII